MKRGIIITLPRYDDTTEYLSQWSYEIQEEANKKSIKIKELRDKQANRKEFEKAIDKLNLNMIIFNGHGSESTICGHDDEILIKEGENDNLLARKITYSRSCESAASLGIKCMDGSPDGCFIGYNFPFMFYINHKWVTNPRKDKLAGLFLSSSNLVPISILKGNSCFNAHEKSRKQFLKNIKKVLRDKTKESFLIAEALWNNYSGQTIIGKKKAQL
jgi:hypothetical protein